MIGVLHTGTCLAADSRTGERTWPQRDPVLDDVNAHLAQSARESEFDEDTCDRGRGEDLAVIGGVSSSHADGGRCSTGLQMVTSG